MACSLSWTSDSRRSVVDNTWTMDATKCWSTYSRPTTVACWSHSASNSVYSATACGRDDIHPTVKLRAFQNSNEMTIDSDTICHGGSSTPIHVARVSLSQLRLACPLLKKSLKRKNVRKVLLETNATEQCHRQHHICCCLSHPPGLPACLPTAAVCMFLFKALFTLEINFEINFEIYVNMFLSKEKFLVWTVNFRKKEISKANFAI